MDPFLDLSAGQYVVLSQIEMYICSYSACALASSAIISSLISYL
jgi:hypothetical protein